MIFKWIVCKVQDSNKASFSAAQSKWAGLSNVDGFIGQLGGWDLNAPNDACIIALWRDEESYRNFMDQHHDPILKETEQATTYDSIEVALFETVHLLSGAKPRITSCLKAAKVIRAADCVVHPDRSAHFDKGLKNVIIPEIGRAPGMLAGYFNRATTDDIERFLITTLWESMADQEEYVINVLPELKEMSALTTDLEKYVTRLVEIDSDWLIVSPQAEQSYARTVL